MSQDELTLPHVNLTSWVSEFSFRELALVRDSSLAEVCRNSGDPIQPAVAEAVFHPVTMQHNATNHLFNFFGKCRGQAGPA